MTFRRQSQYICCCSGDDVSFFERESRGLLRVLSTARQASFLFFGNSIVDLKTKFWTVYALPSCLYYKARTQKHGDNKPLVFQVYAVLCHVTLWRRRRFAAVGWVKAVSSMKPSKMSREKPVHAILGRPRLLIQAAVIRVSRDVSKLTLSCEFAFCSRQCMESSGFVCGL